MENLSSNNIVLDPLSFQDKNGRLFRVNGQVFRGIFEHKAPFYRSLFDKEIIQKLIHKNLFVETEISDFKIDGYNFIVKHRTIPFITYAHEWCSDMFKDATLLHIDLTLELGKYDLTLLDANTLNILFDGYRPVFIDFCSIDLAENNFHWPGKTAEKFNLRFIHFLRLMQYQYIETARILLMHSYGANSHVLQEQVEAFRHCYSNKWTSYNRNQIFKQAKSYIPSNIRPFAKHLFSVNNKRQNKESRLSFLRTLKREVEDIQIPRFKKKSLMSYDNFFASLHPSPEWTTKQKSVHHILSELKPKSVLDMDSNQGWYAQLAAVCGSQVVAFDEDESCVQKLYNDAKTNNLSIVPLALDWIARDTYLSNEFISPPNQRIQCDLVICLTIVQHLIFKRGLGFELIFNKLFQFCQRWLLVEFIPHAELEEIIPPLINNIHTLEWCKKTSWYSLEEFIDIFKCQFGDVQVFPSYPDSRCLLLCDKFSR